MTRSKPGTREIPDPRSPGDRRQRDGFGLLPRTTSISERRQRSELNRLLGWLLLVLGLTSWSAGLLHADRSETSSSLIGSALGLYISARGLRLVTWRDRRKTDRRRGERSAAPDVELDPAAIVSSTGHRFQFRRPGKPKGAPGKDMQVSPPEVK